MTDFKPISIQEQVKEAKRELGMRYGFYTKQVKAGRMTQEDADQKLNAQTNIVKTLEALAGTPSQFTKHLKQLEEIQ